MAQDKKPYNIPKDKEYDFKKDYEEDWDVHSKYILDFDAYESMIVSQVFDSVSRSVEGSKITDSYATTLARERADRAMAKLPEGVTESVGRADVGKAAFMDILRQKWIYPNANAQHPFLEKLNMWEFYASGPYGYMPMFYDWNVSPTGYVGPDCWLWNPRNLVPQQGKSSIADMDYVTALTWVSKRQLKAFRKSAKKGDGWDTEALDLLIEIAENEKTDQDQEKDTQVARNRTPGNVKKGVCLATRYEAGEDGKWCTFAPDHGCVQVREIPNPHKNGRIPFVILYGDILFDSFYGLGEFQRQKPLQAARDGLTNFYFHGIKNQLIPPLVANANGVLKHTLDYRAGGVILETLPNSVRTLEVGTTGLNTYQAAMSSMTGQMLALSGSQNASLPASESLNPSQGKTPAAIDLYSNKEATRDGARVRRLERAIEQLMDGFFSLVVNIGTEAIPVQLFSKDIEAIANAGLTDVRELFMSLTPDSTETAGTLKINPEILKGVEYRFNIEGGSTTKQNKEKSLMALKDMTATIVGMKDVLMNDPRIEVNWPLIMKSFEEFSDIKGASGFITVNQGPSPLEEQLMAQVQQLQMALQEMQGQMEAQMQQMEAERQQVALDKRDADNQRQNEETVRTVTDLAKEVQAAQVPPEPPAEPVVNGGGQMFNTPEIGQVADAINKL